MKKVGSILLTLIALVLIGAGCDSSYSVTETQPQQESAAQPATAVVNEVVETQPPATNTKVTTPDPEPKLEPTPVPASRYSCNCSKTCDEIATCDEAFFQLEKCGCSIRDRDGDGIPCDTMCQ